MARNQEQWGGEVQLPGWLRRMLRMPARPDDTPERAHEARKPEPGVSAGNNADRAAVGALSDLYNEGRNKRP